MSRLLYYSTLAEWPSAALLPLRLTIGLAFMFHGWPKIQNPFGWMGPEAFAPAPLQALAAVAEFGGGLAWMLGLLTPVASLGILCTMCVGAAKHILDGDPFVGRGPVFEPALAYASVALFLLIAGPGRFSLDAFFFAGSRDPAERLDS